MDGLRDDQAGRDLERAPEPARLVVQEPLPDAVWPMLARLAGELPEPRSASGFEFKWDGLRAIAICQDGRLRLLSRNQEDITRHYPERRGLAGSLGTRGAVLNRLADLLAPLATPASPFAGPLPGPAARGPRWVEPRLVTEVELLEWTGSGRLRAPAFKRLLEDRDPATVTRGAGS